MRLLHSARALLTVLVLAISATVLMADFAEARRGGGFGSRGMRTFERPAPTRTAPNEARPIDRSMTPQRQGERPDAQPAARQSAAQSSAGQPARSGFGGMFGGLLGGLMLGGLIGLMMGQGLGGLAGLFGLLIQVGLLALVVVFALRLLRGQRSVPALAGAGHAGTVAGRGGAPSHSPYASAEPRHVRTVDAPAAGANAYDGGADEIGLTAKDFDAFERLLLEVQEAFAREDYARLRALATPEIVSYLSEELSQNAVNGVRNDVSDVRLVQGDLSEAWREGEAEFATVAMRYESVDLMRDRASGDIVDGDAAPSETTEVWTFTRTAGADWKLSAIQDD